MNRPALPGKDDGVVGWVEPPVAFRCMVCGDRETCEPCKTANRGDTHAVDVRLTWPPGVVEQTLFDDMPHHPERR